MTLSIGTRLGPYEILSALGAGGMGEVYRARDTRLNRDVALKVLPELFAADADRLARFKREAQVLASLNHPNIAGIYGVEETPGVTALVLELVEGETLDERIRRPEGLRLPDDGGGRPSGLPIDEALPIARQIAEALEAAHEHGVIHRDLKPANIKISPDGVVKVLDFGLAKALDPPAASNVNATMSPTLSLQATMAGVILGTAAYMSPEQARGRTVDRRADIWAFGVVVYEMLTGRRAFEGDDLSITLAGVLKTEPDWSALPSETPVALRRLLMRCLKKDPKERLQAIGDARIDIGEILSGTSEWPTVTAAGGDGTTNPGRQPLWRRMTPIAAAFCVSALLAGGGVWLLTRPASPSVVRMTVTTSGSAALMLNGFDRDVAITPDGSRVVYRGNNQLLVRALNQLEPMVLTGLGAPQGVFISPDGQWVGFVDGNTIKKVAITGGPPMTLATRLGSSRGATWGDDGSIIFATSLASTGLQRVSAAGGEPTVLTKPDRERGEGDHLWPEFLPGGKGVLFTITPVNEQIENAQIAVLDLATGTYKALVRGGSHAHYVPTGHLVYGLGGMLRAVAFNLGRLEVVGTPVPVLEGVVTTAPGAADVAVAANGSLVYVPGAGSVGDRRTVVSVDRQGRASPLPGLPLDTYRDVRVSPDGARLALATQTDVWTYDVARAALSRLTTDPAWDTSPLWTPDGKRIIFTSQRAGYAELFWRPADGTGSDERLLARAKGLVDLRGNGWSADGRQLLFTEVPLPGRCPIGQVAIERPSDVTVLVKSESCNDFAAVSPDGRWMAYNSSVSGRYEIYVERYPALGDRQQISSSGGRLPLWSRDGRELFFSSLDSRQMLAVPVQSGTALLAGRPQVIFDGAMLPIQSGSRPYDIAPDGRFLIIRNAQAEAGAGAASNMILVQNWFEELKRLVPVN